MSSPLVKPTDGTTAGSAESGLPKVEAAKAAEILELYESSEQAGALLQDDMAPDAFLEALLKEELVEEAISFLAYALPGREAIWWGVRCVRAVSPAELQDEETAALEAVDTWLAEPSDENRRAAFTAAEAATYGTPAGCIALAVFFTEGSMSPVDCPEVPVGEGFCARTVAAAVHLSSVAYEPLKASETARGFVDLGIEVAGQPAPWEAAEEGQGD